MEGIFSGIKLNYERYGQGEPFILLHGNGEDNSIFTELISELKNDYTVYAIDSRCHGKSQSAPLHYDLMAEDVKCFIEDLGLNKPNLYGFSDGGIVGIVLAAKYPNLLGTLVSSGANVTPKGLKWYVRAFFKVQNLFKPSPFLELMLKEPNLTESDLNAITVPTLILCGSADMVPYKHSEYIARSIPNATLKVLKGENHGSYVINSPKLYPIIKSYFK
ncbi:MAG: alpha/beta hydrolase [Clostridia bacterium]|nr:alpha/beta hydrolase [Clostridia bacterium]